MCGIVGIYGHQKKEDAKKMISVLKHRGPDGFGLWSDDQNKITFGHVRLSIIDTSIAGRQPMSFDNERYWITFNGEIYNYKELKEELTNIGCNFKTNTDTEVILAAFSLWGKSFVNKLIGMFSFAIFDRYASPNTAKLFLYRDRFGIKPLLYTYYNHTLYFASELSALLTLNFIPIKISEDSVLEYLAFGTTIQPNSIIDGIQSVPAGFFLEVFDNYHISEQYWDLHNQTSLLRQQLINISYEKAVEQIRLLLVKSIKYNLVSDVEIGVFLSGGIDSTAILGLMNDESTAKINTYSVGFENKFKYIDETKFAQIASNYYNSKHRNLIIDTESSIDFFENIIHSLDQPSLDGTNTWLVSKGASEEVKVALSGLGGDEIFAGYPHFNTIYKNQKKILYGNKIINIIINCLHKWRPNFITLKLLARFSPFIEYISNQRRVLENFEINNFVNSKWKWKFKYKINKIYNNWILKDADIVQQISYIEIKGYLQSILLKDSDIMSMAHGLEVRPVLLDHNLVEFVYSLPAELKINNECNKKIFIDSVGDIFPESLKNRKKMGFELPFISWINGPLNKRFENLFRSKIANSLFTNKYIDLQLNLIKNGKATHATWSIGILIAWVEKNKIKI